MSTQKKRLYELLPVIYRMRDHEHGEPLRDGKCLPGPAIP